MCCHYSVHSLYLYTPNECFSVLFIDCYTCPFILPEFAVMMLFKEIWCHLICDFRTCSQHLTAVCLSQCHLIKPKLLDYFHMQKVNFSSEKILLMLLNHFDQKVIKFSR